MLELAGAARPGQQEPNVLLAAVHFLLLGGARHPLSSFYPSLTATPELEQDPYPAFRAFCLEHRAALVKLISTRLVQTNEIGRSAGLLPALGQIATMVDGGPLFLVEIGASAGLNLLFDRYAYDYGAGHFVGRRDSRVVIRCRVQGAYGPPLPGAFPSIGGRVGIDLKPLDARHPDDVLWLRALVWPEHSERAAMLERALAIAAVEPPPIIRADALDALPNVLSGVSRDVTPVIVHAATLAHFTAAARQRFTALLFELAGARTLFQLSMERDAVEPYEDMRFVVRVSRLTGGERHDRTLAMLHPHGRWIEWVEAASAVRDT